MLTQNARTTIQPSGKHDHADACACLPICGGSSIHTDSHSDHPGGGRHPRLRTVYFPLGILVFLFAISAGLLIQEAPHMAGRVAHSLDALAGERW